jgi:hypothetical protein
MPDQLAAHPFSSCSWDEKFFKQVTEMLLRLSKEPSVKGLSRHLVRYGEKKEQILVSPRPKNERLTNGLY